MDGSFHSFSTFDQSEKTFNMVFSEEVVRREVSSSAQSHQAQNMDGWMEYHCVRKDEMLRYYIYENERRKSATMKQRKKR